MEVIAVFDIGKTNKKCLLFDKGLKPVYTFEESFPEIEDEDGFPCDDLVKIRSWIMDTLEDFKHDQSVQVKAVNFSTYGATLMHLDASGKEVTPLYNYLKPMPENIMASFYDAHGGVNEFSRKTASPALGFLNSGLQLLWLKKQKPDLFSRIRTTLHFPQYCSYLLTGKMVSEYTSIGCHTALWDFDQMTYHPWLSEEDIRLPDPIANSTLFESNIPGLSFLVGCGIHDSSASLAPYLLQQGDPFIILSTGTWCINMNPFNAEPLTKDQLSQDSLCYMSVNQKPVKSSRFFMGHIHDINIDRLNQHFHLDDKAYKEVRLDKNMARYLKNHKTTFFSNGIPPGYVDESVDLSAFSSFTEAYHRLMMDLTEHCMKSIRLILPAHDDTKQVFVSGGFGKNDLFTGLLAESMPDKTLSVSAIDNASALGAAMVIYKNAGFGDIPTIDHIH